MTARRVPDFFAFSLAAVLMIVGSRLRLAPERGFSDQHGLLFFCHLALNGVRRGPPKTLQRCLTKQSWCLRTVEDFPTLLCTQFRHCVVIASFAVKAFRLSMEGGKG